MRESELVGAALDGDPRAFADLAAAARPRVTALVARMVGDLDDAEDVTQEALLRAYLGLSRLRDRERFTAWVAGIAVNVAKMRLRRRALERRVVAGTFDRPPVEPEEHELLALVREAVELLPPSQRDVVLLHYVDGLSASEIAALLGRSPGAVRVRLHRARAQLRGELAFLAPPTQPPKEETVTTELTLHDVLVRVAEDDDTKPVDDQRVVLLTEADGDRLLPIWIGAAEGNTLALQLAGETTPRPVTPDLMAELVRVTGARVERVTITSLRDRTFYAVIALEVAGSAEELDARPSDAINLAVRVGAPIFVDVGVLDENATTSEEFSAHAERAAEEMGLEVPPGTWRSVSAELVRSLFAPWPKP